MLRDPLGLAEPFALDAEFTPVLDLMDGGHTTAQIRQSLLLRGGPAVPQADLDAFAADLRAAGWLDDSSFRARWRAMLEAFLDAPVRAARLAGTLYPAEPAALARALDQALPGERTRKAGDTVAVMLPHHPFEAAAPILDATLKDLPPASALDLVVVFGTDHSPGLVPLCLTAKPYATPLGEVPSDPALVDALARRIPELLREEIRHRNAQSLELAAVLLRHVYGERCPPALMVLCGKRAGEPEGEDEVARFVAALESCIEDKRVLMWGSGELSHAGPAYGHASVGAAAREELAERDRGCLDALARGHVRELARRCAIKDPQGPPSGGAVMQVLAFALPPGVRGTVTAYAAVDAPGGGFAGLGGARFRAAR